MSFMVTIFSTIAFVFSSTCYELTYMNNKQIKYYTVNDLYYNILPVDVTTDVILKKIVSIFVLCVTGFFLMPVSLLFYIQIRNFVANRTTNERFSRRAPAKRRNSSRVSVATGERSDSTGSSLLSANQTILAEDIIKDMAGAEDYSDRWFTCFLNCFAMTCHRTPVSQLEIYKAIVKNKDGMEGRCVSVNSSAHIDEEIEE